MTFDLNNIKFDVCGHFLKTLFKIPLLYISYEIH